jgi:hypothetical protein
VKPGKRWKAALAAALAAGLAALGASGCPVRPALVEPEFPRNFIPEGGGAPVRVEVGPADADVADQVMAALTEAYPKATYWGAFRVEVHVRVYHTHEALEAVLGRRHLDWLRAWATYDAVLLQSPRTWGGEEPEKRLSELLKHELCHVSIYQLVAARESWEKIDLPLWFREGLASWTAGQEYRRGHPRDIGEFLLLNPGADPLLDPDPLLLASQDKVYAAAHWAFDALYTRWKEKGVRDILAGVARGLDFARAFHGVTGLGPVEFAERWREDVEHLASADGAHPKGTAGD